MVVLDAQFKGKIWKHLQKSSIECRHNETECHNHCDVFLDLIFMDFDHPHKFIYFFACGFICVCVFSPQSKLYQVTTLTTVAYSLLP